MAQLCHSARTENYSTETNTEKLGFDVKHTRSLKRSGIKPGIILYTQEVNPSLGFARNRLRSQRLAWYRVKYPAQSIKTLAE